MTRLIIHEEADPQSTTIILGSFEKVAIPVVLKGAHEIRFWRCKATEFVEEEIMRDFVDCFSSF